MTPICRWLALATMVVAFSACAPAATPPTAAPPKPAATAAPAKPAEAKPAPSPAAKAEAKPAADWEREWQQTLEAARREGQVAVIGQAGRESESSLTEQFQSKYGIKVEFLATQGAQVPPRISTERGAGQYLWDVVVQGTTTLLGALLPLGVLDPIEPLLVLPEVKDGRNWRGGAPEFLDPEKKVVVLTPFQRGTLFVNTTLVSPEEFKSYKDLLDPKWKGKIVMHDPRIAGPGQGTFTLFFLHPELGADFIRAIGSQEITILRDFQQELNALGQGRFPVLIGAPDLFAEPLIKQGAYSGGGEDLRSQSR